MNGHERLIILLVLLFIVVGWNLTLLVRFYQGNLSFDEAKGEVGLQMAFVAGLLIKLPPAKDENVQVQGEDVTVTER